MAVGSFLDDGARQRYQRAYEQALAQMESPDRTADVPTAFGTVRAYVWDTNGVDGVPVLLLPGRSSGVPMWQENLADLLPHRRVIAFDALGDAGMSQQTAPLTSMADQACWIDEALTWLGENRVHLVGHSFGGATAAAVAVERPGRVASLALLEPVFTLAWPPLPTFLWTTVASLPVPQRVRDQALARIGGVHVADIRARTPVSEMIASASSGFRAALPVPRLLSQAQLAGLQMPVYVAIAQRSSLAGGERAANRARTIPHAQVEIWPDTTHSLPMQAHDRLAERLADFWSAAPEWPPTPPAAGIDPAA